MKKEIPYRLTWNIIYKYRVIVEYITKILDEIVYMEIKKYKEENPNDYFDKNKRINKKWSILRL